MHRSAYPFDSLTESGLAGFDYSNRTAALSVESDASLFLTSAQSRRAFAISSQAGFNRCYADSLIAALPPSLTAFKLRRL